MSRRSYECRKIARADTSPFGRVTVEENDSGPEGRSAVSSRNDIISNGGDSMTLSLANSTSNAAHIEHYRECIDI
jgi:hypothetical protein